MRRSDSLDAKLQWKRLPEFAKEYLIPVAIVAGLIWYGADTYVKIRDAKQSGETVEQEYVQKHQN